MSLPTRLPFDLMVTKWAAELNPLLSCVLTQGFVLTNVSLGIGQTVINHKLGRKQQGWYIVDLDGAASIYRSAPLNEKTLTLTSDAVVKVSVWVF